MVRPQWWRAACVDWKQTGGERWLEVVRWALASRWPWESYTQTCRWQNKLQKVGLERTHNNSTWPVFVSVHSNWPCLITATTFVYTLTCKRWERVPVRFKEVRTPFFFKTISSSHWPSLCFHFGDWTQFKCSQTLHQTSLCSFRHWPTFNREHVSGAPTHSTGVIMQPTPGRHFGSGASHLRNVACSDELVWKP